MNNINFSGKLNSIINRPELDSDKPAAQALFCGLGEEWWKQVIDGRYHQFGPMVFDQGLHFKHRTEPGFYQSLVEALDYTKEHLCEPLTSDFYCELHKKACAHFKGKENHTDMPSYMAGQFRARGELPVDAIFKDQQILECFLRNNTSNANQERLIKDYEQVKNYLNNSPNIETLIADLKEDGLVKLISLEQYNELDALYQAKYQELIRYTQQLDPRIVPTFSTNYNWVRLSYPREDLHHLVDVVIDDYNRTIARLNQEAPSDLAEKKLEAIADIYQKLEWLHPFRDGQGRTDLILLSKLLSENGFNPPILFEPYVSSFCSLEEWTAYLKEGIEKWKDLKASKP